MFPRDYANYRDYVEKDRIVILKGRASYRERVREDEEGGAIVEVLAEALAPLGGGASSSQNGFHHIVVRLDEGKQDKLRFVRDTIEQYRGNGNARPVYLHVCAQQRRNIVKTPLVAEYTDEFRSAIERLLGKQSIWAE